MLNGKFHFEFPFCFSEAFPNIESNIELNHFSAKFKHLIESDRVSPTPRHSRYRVKALTDENHE